MSTARYKVRLSPLALPRGMSIKQVSLFFTTVQNDENSTVNLSVVAGGEVIGFVLAGYIIVNADVAYCFVFTNKAVVLLSTILTAAFMDSNQDKCRERKPEIR